MRAKFGPAGNSISFKQSKGVDLLKYLKSFGLSAYEYQCGMGVRISCEKAKEFGNSLDGISISVHAPYYISLSSIYEEKRLKSVDYILKTARVAKSMGATRIVVHSGSCMGLKRDDALNFSISTLKNAVAALREEGLQDVSICPETMGKINQLGDLFEVLKHCKIDESLIPCVDFGHLNARTFGGLKIKSDYLAILNAIENELGFNRLRFFHAHFSKVEYTLKGGEKKHLTFSDCLYGPDWEPLAELIAKKNLAPTVICESAGTQAEDAEKMQNIYRKFFE